MFKAWLGLALSNLVSLPLLWAKVGADPQRCPPITAQSWCYSMAPPGNSSLQGEVVWIPRWQDSISVNHLCRKHLYLRQFFVQWLEGSVRTSECKGTPATPFRIRDMDRVCIYWQNYKTEAASTSWCGKQKSCFMLLLRDIDFSSILSLNRLCLIFNTRSYET